MFDRTPGKVRPNVRAISMGASGKCCACEPRSVGLTNVGRLLGGRVGRVCVVAGSGVGGGVMPGV